MSKKVLVVDDEPELVEALQVRLEANNYEVVTAEDGVMALSKLKQEKPDLIILDIMMPKMDGVSFIREMKGIDGLGNTPVIVLTAKGLMEGVLKEEGVTDYIQKPFAAEDLLKIIQKHLA